MASRERVEADPRARERPVFSALGSGHVAVSYVLNDDLMTPPTMKAAMKLRTKIEMVVLSSLKAIKLFIVSKVCFYSIRRPACLAILMVSKESDEWSNRYYLHYGTNYVQSTRPLRAGGQNK